MSNQPPNQPVGPPPPAPVAPRRATVTIFEQILRNAPAVLNEIDRLRQAGVPDYLMRVLIAFNQLNEMRVVVREFGTPDHGAVVTTYMAPDAIATADILIDDSPVAGQRGDIIGLMRRR